MMLTCMLLQSSHPELLTKLKVMQATEYKRVPHCVLSQVLSARSTNGNKSVVYDHFEGISDNRVGTYKQNASIMLNYQAMEKQLQI